MVEDWSTREEQDKVPIVLEEEDFHMACDIIEDLFEHIRRQNQTVTDVVEMGRSIKDLGGSLREDINKLRKRKKMLARSSRRLLLRERGWSVNLVTRYCTGGAMQFGSNIARPVVFFEYRGIWPLSEDLIFRKYEKTA